MGTARVETFVRVDVGSSRAQAGGDSLRASPLEAVRMSRIMPSRVFFLNVMVMS
jgi:hypothetical protein